MLRYGCAPRGDENYCFTIPLGREESQATLCFNPSKYAEATYLFFVAEVCNENRVSFKICETKSDYRFKELQRKRVIVANICNDIV